MGSVETPVCSALWCPAGSRRSIEFVLLVLHSESCFLPQEDDALSVLPLRRWRERAAVKSDLPQCLMVAKWSTHRSQSGSKCSERDSAVFGETDVGLEMKKMTCRKFETWHMFLWWNKNKIWHAVLCCGLRLNFDLPYFSGRGESNLNKPGWFP